MILRWINIRVRNHRMPRSPNDPACESSAENNIKERWILFQAFVYVSTAFANSDRHEIDEIVYPTTIAPKYMIELVTNPPNGLIEKVNQVLFAIFTIGKVHNYHVVYFIAVANIAGCQTKHLHIGQIVDRAIIERCELSFTNCHCSTISQ